MFFDHRYERLREARYYLDLASYAVQYAASLPLRLTREAQDRLAAREDLLSDNRRLRELNRAAAGETQKYAALLQENNRLRELLGVSRRFADTRIVAAELIAASNRPSQRRIVINKGRRHAAYIGQPVLGTGGVIGQIVSVTPFSAAAILVSDPGHAMMVEVRRSGLRAVAVGSGDPRRVKLRYVSLDAPVRAGDMVTTSGLDARYPADYPVGRIERVGAPGGDGFVEVWVRLFETLERRSEVLLVWDK